MTRKRRTSKDNRKQRIQHPPHLSHPVRSGFEKKIAEQLQEMGVDYGYEDKSIPYQEIRNVSYTPDFTLPNGILIESKGAFSAKDRKKHLLIAEQHPELDIRFVLMRPNDKLYKGSKTRIRDWLNKHGFIWAIKEVPIDWIKEVK